MSGVSRLGGLNCPFCRYYNARDEQTCGRCGRRLPPPGLAPFINRLGSVDLWATKALGAVSAVVFALQLAVSGPRAAEGLTRGFSRDVLLRFGSLTNGLEWSEPWRLLAACFVHANLIHIAMNLLSLASLGRAGERLIGASRFVVAYVVTGVAGFVVSTLWYGTDPYTTMGASGAVLGLYGVLLGDRMVRRDPAWKDMLVRTVVVTFLFYFALGTNQAAHLGGLAAGLALGALFALEKRPQQRDGLFGGLAAASGFAIVLSLILPHFSTAIRPEPRPAGARAREPRREPARRAPAPPAERDPAGEGDAGDEAEP